MYREWLETGSKQHHIVTGTLGLRRSPKIWHSSLCISSCNTQYRSNFNVCDPKASLLPQSRSEIFTFHVCSLQKRCPKWCLPKCISFGTLLVIINYSSTTLVSTNNRKTDVLSELSGYLRYFATESVQRKEGPLWARPAGLRCLQQQQMFATTACWKDRNVPVFSLPVLCSDLA